MIVDTFDLITRTLSEIHVFEKQSDDKVAQSQGKVKKSVKTLRKIWAFRSIASRLNRIEKLLQVEKYDLAFIGKVGAGKTTAICHLFNLLREERKIIDVNGDQLEEKAIKEILATGAGRTTICEVVIRTHTVSLLEIDPYSEQEVKESIEIFCVYTWKRIHPQSQEAPDISEFDLVKSDALPAELKRAVRNLVGLKEVTRQGNQIDEAAELAKRFVSYRDFRDEVVKRAKLSDRTTDRLQPDWDAIQTVASQKEWIEKKFNEINLCSLSDVSIPRRIYVYLSPEILDLSEYPINSIIDTRGIDEGKDREDLSNYIRDNDETICIFTEKFSDVPTNVIGLIRKYLTLEAKDIDTKLAVVAMPRKGEPGRVIGQSGLVSSKEEGIKVRTNQIKDSFEGQNVNFLSENILFYDALQFYDDEERVLKSRYSQDHVKKERNLILKEFKELIERRKNKLRQEVCLLSELFHKIKDGELSSEDENRIKSLKKTIEQCQRTNFSFGFETDYVQALKSHHVMVFRAINNRYGIYAYKGISIYFDAKSLAEDLVRRRFGDPKSEIVGAIKNTEEGASEISGLKPVLEVLRGQVDEYYESLAIQVGKEVYDLLSDDKFAPLDSYNQFWVRIQGRWGQGKGYRDDVLKTYRGQLEAVDEFLRAESQKLWHQEFMAKILEFFAEDE